MYKCIKETDNCLQSSLQLDTCSVTWEVSDQGTDNMKEVLK